MDNWHYVSTKERVQEIRGYERYLNYKKNNECIDLSIVNTVFTHLNISDLIPLAKESHTFSSVVESSIKCIGIKDPFVIHSITNVPKGFKSGLFIKSGNNRYYICQRMNLDKVPCVVVNISGENGISNGIKGEELNTVEDVRKLFHVENVHVVFRDGKICNARIPKWLRVQRLY